MHETLPNLQVDLIDIPSLERLEPRAPSRHKPRILLLYGSTRHRSTGCPWRSAPYDPLRAKHSR